MGVWGFENGDGGEWEVLGAGGVVRASLDVAEDAIGGSAAVYSGSFSATGTVFTISEAFDGVSVEIASQAESFVRVGSRGVPGLVSSNEESTCTCSGLISAAIDASGSGTPLSPPFGF